MSSDKIERNNANAMASLANKSMTYGESHQDILSIKVAQATKIIRELSSGKNLSPTERLKVLQYFENDGTFCRALLVEFIEG